MEIAQIAPLSKSQAIFAFVHYFNCAPIYTIACDPIDALFPNLAISQGHVLYEPAIGVDTGASETLYHSES